MTHLPPFLFTKIATFSALGKSSQPQTFSDAFQHEPFHFRHLLPVYRSHQRALRLFKRRRVLAERDAGGPKGPAHGGRNRLAVGVLESRIRAASSGLHRLQKPRRRGRHRADVDTLCVHHLVAHGIDEPPAHGRASAQGTVAGPPAPAFHQPLAPGNAPVSEPPLELEAFAVVPPSTAPRPGLEHVHAPVLVHPGKLRPRGPQAPGTAQGGLELAAQQVARMAQGAAERFREA